MHQFSEENIKKNCPHCDINSQAFVSPLEDTENFHIICDAYPITRGHILVIPKKHYSCIGEYSNTDLLEFEKIYNKIISFLSENFGHKVATFEHGVVGQTVFHSHIHLLPYNGTENDIVAEEDLTQIEDLNTLQEIYKKEGKYLFFSLINSSKQRNFLVDTSIGAPRFFRDRFATALGNPEHGNWKEMHHNEQIMKKVDVWKSEILSLWKSIKI